MLEGRLPGHGEPVDQLQARGILLDGSSIAGDKRLLLQIFSETLMGPVFSSSSSAKATMDLARVTSRRCSNPLSAIRCVAVYWPPSNVSKA
jgi:hypothetical protein